MINKDKLNYDVTDGGDIVGSYLKSADGTLLTHTDNGGKKSLDVNVANTIDISATNLDIRDLAFATDSVTAHQGGTWTIDSITNPVTVSATDLDIRNLDYSQDNVAIKGSTGNQLVINADGSINANVDVSVVNGSDKAEDSAHASGDVGTYILGVRQDVLSTSTSANGDYQSLKSDLFGRMFVNEAHQAIAHAAVSVTSSATQLVASPLSGRKRILIQNLGTKDMYVGNSGVTTSNGLRVGAGASAEFLFDYNIDVYAISTATINVRVLEMA